MLHSTVGIFFKKTEKSGKNPGKIRKKIRIYPENGFSPRKFSNSIGFISCAFSILFLFKLDNFSHFFYVFFIIFIRKSKFQVQNLIFKMDAKQWQVDFGFKWWLNRYWSLCENISCYSLQLCEFQLIFKMDAKQCQGWIWV